MPAVAAEAASRRALRHAAILLSAAALEGCGGSGDSAGGAGGGTAGAGGGCTEEATSGDLPCDVADVLKARCQNCHTDPLMNNAKFPLLTYEDTQVDFGTTGKRRWQRMAEVIAPSGLPHMPKDYAIKGELSAAQLDTLRGWFATCAPPAAEGKGCDVGE